MAEIFEYTDYREFLRARYADLKVRYRHYSYRFLAQRIGFKAPGLFTLVLQGKRNLSQRFVNRFAEAFKLNKRETVYFEQLVAYNQAKTHEDKKRLFDRLVWSRGTAVKVVQPDQYAFYDEWYHSALRELIAVQSFSGDFAALGRSLEPPISPGEARKSVELLLKLGLVEKDGNGLYRRSETSVTTGESWRSLAIQHYQRQALDLAKGAYDRIPKEDRDISTLTLSCSRDTFAAIREKVRQLRREIAEIASHDDHAEGVFQLNFQVFPLSRDPESRRRKAKDSNP